MIHPRPRSLRLLLCLALAAAGSCKSSGPLPPIEGVRSAADGRSSLLATISVAPLDQISGDVDSLSRTLGLPFAGKDLLSMLAAQNKLDPQTMAQIDTSRPVGVALVAPAAKDKEPLAAMVLSARSAADAEKLVAGMGPVAEKQRGARKVTRPDGSAMWVATQGTTLYGSDSLEGLLAASALAADAHRPPANDLVITVFADAFAHWRGTDVRTALAQFRQELIDEQVKAAAKRGSPVPGPAERLAYETTLDMFLQPVSETASAALTLDLDAQKGIRFGLRMDPRPGSPFAKRVATRAPYLLDPTLFNVDSDLAAVWALGAGSFWVDVYDKVFQAQARANMRGAADVSRQFQALRPYLAGGGSGVVRLQRGALTQDSVFAIKQAGNPAGALDAITALTTSRAFVDFLGEIYGKASPQVRARRERDTVHTELAFPVRDRPGDPGTVLKAFFGSPTLAWLTTTSNGRLVVVSEPTAAARLAALGGPPTKAPTGDLAAALADTRGQDGFFYVDLWSLVKPAIAAAASPQEAAMINMATSMPGFANLKLPMVMSYGGGQSLSAEWRVPLSTLSNAATVARPFLGMAR
jgi:hypothetical protein